MGHMQAMGLAGAVDEGWSSLDAALSIHLSSNHYPPLPLEYVPMCKEAIALAAAAVRAGDDDAWTEVMLDLPDGVDPTPRLAVDGQVALGVAVDIFHLDAFIDPAIDADDLAECEGGCGGVATLDGYCEGGCSDD